MIELAQPPAIIRPAPLVRDPALAMFMVNHLIGFGSGARDVLEQEVNRTTGTAIGNMAGDGGLSAAFDGTTSQANFSCASLANANAYVGKNYTGGAKAYTKIIAYGSNNQGFYRSGNPSITLALMAKVTSPSSGTDGVTLGSLTFTDTGNENAGRTIVSSDPWTKYQYVWCNIISDGAQDACMAELKIFENLNA